MPYRFCSLFRPMSLAMVFALGGSAAWAQTQTQDVLTLDQALRLAKELNGTVRSATMQVKAGDQVVVQALSAFYPSINAQYQYNSDREQFLTNTTIAFAQIEGAQTFLNSSWTLLDTGERYYSLNSARRSRDSKKYNAKQVLRTTLFNVVQQYYNALRTQELEHVAQTEVTRAQTILDQTQTRIKARDAAQIEELQANADYQNAKVTALSARNDLTNAAALLKATIGLSSGAPLPPLQKTSVTTHPNPVDSLDKLILEGVKNRPDLIAQRKNLEAENFSKLLANREAGVTMSLAASYTEQVQPVDLSNRTLTFLINLPLFDAGNLRAQARQIGYNIKADQATLEQAERGVRSDIEAAYKNVVTNGERLDASDIALDAAQKNYDAAVDSQKAGAYDLLQVLTAQVSLVTAESNQIQALYDYRISEVNLQLVTGRPIPGE
jgi:outer membrane protein